MTEPISALIWVWYGADEKSKIESTFKLGNSLWQLALTPKEKNETIPDCMYCELTNQYFGRDTDFLEVCSGDVENGLVLIINEISRTLEDLPPEEAVCFSSTIFSHPSWLKVQELSSQALKIMNWAEISIYECELS